MKNKNNKKNLLYRKAIFLKNQGLKSSGTSLDFFEKEEDAFSNGTIELDIGDGNMEFHSSVKAGKDFINEGTGVIKLYADFNVGGNVKVNGDLFIEGDCTIKGNLFVKGLFVAEGNCIIGGKFDVDRYQVKGLGSAFVFEIPDKLMPKYKGPGFGLIATREGKMIDLLYFEDVSDDHCQTPLRKKKPDHFLQTPSMRPSLP